MSQMQAHYEITKLHDIDKVLDKATKTKPQSLSLTRKVTPPKLLVSLLKDEN